MFAYLSTKVKANQSVISRVVLDFVTVVMHCSCPGPELNLIRPFSVKIWGLHTNCNLLTLMYNKKLSYCWETVRRESMPRIAEMDVEMTT